MAGPNASASLRSIAKDEKPQSTRAVTSRLLRYLLAHRKPVAQGIAWLVASSTAVAATPALIGKLIDIALANTDGGSTRALTAPALVLVGATLLGWYAQRMQILTLGTAGQLALYQVRAEVFAKVVDLDVGYFESVESGDLMSRLINDIEQINSFLAQGFRRLLSSAFSLTATLVFMLVVEWRLAAATLLVVPVMLGVTRLFGMIARRAFRKRQEAIGDVSATLAEELGGIKVAQAFDRTDRNRDAFASRNAVNRDANIGAAVVSSAFSPVLAVISTAASALVAALGGWGAARGLITIGVVVAFLNYARQFFNAVTQLSSLYSETQSALAGGERVFQLIDTVSEVADLPDAVPATAVQGRIEFSGVRFVYRTGPEILHGIDLTISAGETIAIVGPTGAGKTTLINLAARLYDPTGGCVLLDGRDLRTLTLDSLRGSFGIVLQEPFLFSGTVAQNIRYGSLTATDEQVRRAAELAGAAFIHELPDGFETAISERGATLSTGQRQLLAFARAIVGDPAVLILDEATSSVDTRTELLIQKGLRNILEGRTALIIAHRLSTVRDAHRIVVLEDGRIVEQGTYGSLLAAHGAFSALHDAQFGD
ncbi:MAG: ABC transporter ATP-binding protein [Actinobacteria bacterium HGW-Actinobacteria-7]|nr:MAG: ABC transporter ATP-binding protein [Actinobacteria bacterium HGW-Actinobacteria-7]